MTKAILALSQVLLWIPFVGAQASREGFQKILWLHGTAVQDEEFFTTVKLLGFNAVDVSGGDDPALPGQHGLAFYHDQICGKGILELRDEQIGPLVDAYTRDREDSILTRPVCLSSTDTLLQLSELLSGRLRSSAQREPLAVSLGDEISVTRHANPLDLCFGPACLRSFRGFVRDRYGTIDRLNAAWTTDYASIDRVRPFTADAIRAREFDGVHLPDNLEPWALHREFMDRELARIVHRLVEQIEREAPSLPAGLTGIQQPSAYGGHDYRRLLPGLSFFEVYDIGGARDLAMSMAPTARQVATLFPPEGAVDQGLVKAQIADLLAHGMWGAVVWSSSLVVDQAGNPTAFGAALADGFTRLDPVGEVFANARLVRSPVWLVESQASVRAWWMLDSSGDGATWIKRLSSYEATHSTSLAARHGWIKLLEDLGLQPRLVAEDDLPRLLADGGPRLLVLPATIAISDRAVSAIEKYVEGGGVLAADHSPALFDEQLHLRTEPALDELFAVSGRTGTLGDLRVRQGKPTDDVRLITGAAAAEPRLSSELHDSVSGFRVQMEGERGNGKTFYLNLAVCEYGAVRLDPERLATALDLRRRVRVVLNQAGVVPPVSLRAEGIPTCLERMELIGVDGRNLLAVRVNALAAPGVLAELADKGPFEIDLMFPDEVTLVDIASGAVYERSSQHSLSLDPYAGLFLEVRR